jgi:DNA polymerase epsilon subunit 2
MFQYYSTQDENDTPMTFILMGSFISIPFPANGYSTSYKAHWDDLADILSQFPHLTAQSTFIFIPGPNDPWTTLPDCLPRKPIPEAFTNRIRRQCKHVKFVTNPCRLGFFTQEFTVIRANIADMFIRNRVIVNTPPISDSLVDETTIAQRDVCYFDTIR